MCCYFYFSKIDAYHNAEKADGVVIDRLYGAKRGLKSPSTDYYPQFQFSYHDSLYISADKESIVSGKQIGDKIKIIFPAGQPEEAVIYNFFSYWFSFPAIVVSLFVALFFFAIPFFAEQYSLFRKEYKGR